MSTDASPTPAESVINWDLLTKLGGLEHKDLNVHSGCDEFSAAFTFTCGQGHDHSSYGEVIAEARAVQHLCDMAGVPSGTGYSAHIDARVFQLVMIANDFRLRATRIAAIHARESGPAGMVGDYCTECAHRWPCPTNRLAEGIPLEDDV